MERKEKLRETLKKLTKDVSGAIAYLPDAKKALGGMKKRVQKPGKSIGLQNPKYPSNPALIECGGKV